MKDFGLTTLLATLILASLFGCTNDRKSEKEVLPDSCLRQKPKEAWENIQRPKDSLWTVFNESTNEKEVERAEEMFFELASNAEWYQLVDKEHEKHKARVGGEFQQLVEALPNA